MNLSVGDTVLFCDGNLYTIQKIQFKHNKQYYYLPGFKCPLDENTLLTWAIPFKNAEELSW